MRTMLDGAPERALVVPHVGPVRRRAGELDVVGHDYGAGVQPALGLYPLEVGQVSVLVVIDEDEVERPLRDAVLFTKPTEGFTAVAQGPDDDGHPIVDPGVGEDAPSDVCVGGVELDGPQVGVRRAIRRAL